MATKGILTFITVAIGIAVLIVIAIWLLKRRNIEYVDPFEEMEGDEFEKYCAQLLEAKGYEEVEVTSGSHDYGVDILADRDGISYAIQCKCYSEPIGIKAIQEVYAGKDYYGCMVAVVMTNQYFTKTAEEFAQKLNVMLWDGDIMKKMIMKYGGGFDIQSAIIDKDQSKASTPVLKNEAKKKSSGSSAVMKAVDRLNPTQTAVKSRSISEVKAELQKLDKTEPIQQAKNNEKPLVKEQTETKEQNTAKEQGAVKGQGTAKEQTLTKEQAAIRLQIEAKRAEAAKIQAAVKERVEAEANRESGSKGKIGKKD